MLYSLPIIFSMLLLLMHPAHAEAAGNTYYVATNGNDGNSCSQSSPCRTINHGVTKLQPGDTLTIRGGIYNEEVKNIRSGTSWSNPVTITVYPGETVTIPRITFLSTNVYVVIDGTPGTFIVDAKQYWSVAIQAVTAGYLRFKNLELKNAQTQGIGGCSKPGPGHCEFINLKVHDNGLVHCGKPGFHYGHGQCHGIYSDGDSNLVDGGEYYRNNGLGIHLRLYPTNWIVRNTRLYDNTNGGLIETSGGNNMYYNNIVYNNSGWGGIAVMSNAFIYNNTIYGNKGKGIYARYGGNHIRNNIVYNNAPNFVLEQPSSQAENDHNLTANPTDPRIKY
jgi:parallel beta-helix repeat protein